MPQDKIDARIDLLLRTGRLLMESGADTPRIMRNMKRTAAFLGLPEEHLHIYVQFNMLMVRLMAHILHGKTQQLPKVEIHFLQI